MTDFYALVTNGEIIRPDIPKGATIDIEINGVTESMSPGESDEDHIALGLYPQSEEDDEFDYDTQNLTGAEWVVEGTKVVLRRKAVALDFADVRAQAIESVKGVCGDAILALYPDWKQRNMLEEMSRLRAKESPSGDDTAALSACQNAWDEINSLRNTSNEMEDAVNAAPDNRSAIDTAAVWD